MSKRKLIWSGGLIVTTLTVVQKDGTVAIAADQMSTLGAIRRPATFKLRGSKIIPVNDSFIASAGYSAHGLVINSLAKTHAEDFDLSSADAIFDTFRKLQKTLVDDYFLKTDEDDDEQPYESNQLHILIANSTGIYELQSYREVAQIDRFWSIGSGAEFAMGAMEAIYEDGSRSAKEIAERGVEVGCLFDTGSGLPVESYEIAMKKS